MHDRPSTSELLDAVKRYLDDVARPALTGHAAFSALVASNVVAIIKRELELGPDIRVDELARLQALLSEPQIFDVNTLNKMLCAQLRSGDMTTETPGLLKHLKTTTISQLAVDQPKYSGLSSAAE